MDPSPSVPVGVDYAAVLADLIARRDALSAAIESIRPLAGLKGEASGAIGQAALNSGGATPPSPNGIDLDEHAFFGMSIGEAIMKYLASARKPKTVQEIIEALSRGGVTTASKNFYNTVYTTLKRREDIDGDIVQVQKKWGLASWFPGFRKKPKAGSVPTPDDKSTTG